MKQKNIYPYYKLRKSICLTLGVDAALLLSELERQHDYLVTSRMIRKGDEFYHRQVSHAKDPNKAINEPSIQNATGLSRTTQLLCIKKLTSIGILKSTKKGRPAKNYYAINFEKINEIENFFNVRLKTGGEQNNLSIASEYLSSQIMD